MVNQKILVRDKYRRTRKTLKIFIIIFSIIAILLVVFLIGYFKSGKKIEIVLENPLKDLVFKHTVEGIVDREAVIEEAILEFNEDYINYLLVALGVGNLHKSLVGYGNPVVEFVIDDETWTSELDNGLNTWKGAGEDEDLIISISREEAIDAILTEDVESFIKDSVSSGRTDIEMVAGKVELASKGYLAMYTELTGEEIDLEE